MNKKLIALAVAGAFAMPMAAQAEVTIFGQMHVSVDHFDNDAAGNDSGFGVSSNSSRIGFKGSEDLGGGMKAIWQITTFFNVADQQYASATNQQFNNGNSFVGLTGGWGTALLGRHDTPYKSVGRKVDLFGDTVGDSRTVINQGMDIRPGNVLAYVSPNMNGMQAALAYVTDATQDLSDDTDNDAYSLSLTYGNGPMWVGLGYQNISAPAAADDRTSVRLAGSYAMGDLKFTALWQDDDYTNNTDRTIWGLGAAYKMGSNTIKAQFYTADETAGGADNGYDKWAIGFDHSMSKRTSVYAAYAQVSNDSGSAVNVTAASGHGGSGPLGATVANGDPSAFSVGLVHKF